MIEINRGFIRALLPVRTEKSNKALNGRALICAGSEGMHGAALLCAKAAGRVGAGYVTLASETDPKEWINQAPEFLTAKLSTPELFSKTKWNAIAVGPGLGTGEATYQLLSELCSSALENVVLDADSLTVLAKNPQFKLNPSWILTPHAGEMARLLGISADEVEANREKSVIAAAKKFGCIALLKGHRTLISNGEKTAVNHSGNAALAKAGAGDVLTGVITGFLAQGLSSFDAAALGSFVHGLAADEWLASGRDQLSLLPSDLIEVLPELLYRLRR